MSRSRHVTSLTLLLAVGVATALGAGARPQTTARPVIDTSQLIKDLETLSSDAMAGRRAGTEGGAKARQFLVQRFREAGLRPVGDSFEHPFGNAPDAAPAARRVNVVGALRGARTPNRYLVVSAHYDHVGVRGGEVYNGANDNASGAAALAVIAAYFAHEPPNASMLFVAFDAEEEGMLGSRAFVRAPPVPLDAIVANVNLDMIGRDESRTLWAAGARRFPQLRPPLERVAAQALVTLRLGHDNPSGRASDDWTDESDQMAFIEAGIPGLYLGVEDARYHHRPDDEFGTMMPDFYDGAVRTIIQVISGFDRDIDAIRPLGGAR